MIILFDEITVFYSTSKSPYMRFCVSIQYNIELQIKYNGSIL